MPACGQVRGDLRERQVRPHRGAGRDDAQRQRQVRARADDLLSRGGFRGEPLGTHAMFQ